MAYQVLARKYRPQRFGEMSGQAHVVRTLKNALERGQLAHAFLFTGPRGVGKTTAARLVAKAVNCEQGPTGEPCGTCVPCVEITEGRAVDRRLGRGGGMGPRAGSMVTAVFAAAQRDSWSRYDPPRL